MGLMGAAAIESVGSLAGSWLSGTQSARASHEMMKFQKKMSNTSVRRRKNDLIKAGFNPILAAMDGASTPVGAMPNIPDYGESITRGINSAVSYKQAKEQMKVTKAQAKKEGVVARLYDKMEDFFNYSKSSYRDSLMAGMLASTVGLGPATATIAAATEALRHRAEESRGPQYKGGEYKSPRGKIDKWLMGE